MVDLSKYLTVREASKLVGLTEERVRELILLKEIKATKIGKWRIGPDDLQAFIEARSNR